MNKILLSLSVVLVLVFGAAGITVAAAQQSQPGEALYPLRTWSTQILHRQEKTQIQAGQMGNMVETRSDFHKQEIFRTPQSIATLDPCNQPGTPVLCGSNRGAGVDHHNEHPIQEHNGSEHLNKGENHANDRSDHNSHESDHGHDGDH